MVMTDHLPLTHLDKLSNCQGRLQRWLWDLSEIPHKIKYLAGKLNKLADSLSRREYLRSLFMQLPKGFNNAKIRKGIYDNYLEQSQEDTEELRINVDLEGEQQASLKTKQKKGKNEPTNTNLKELGPSTEQDKILAVLTRHQSKIEAERDNAPSTPMRGEPEKTPSTEAAMALPEQQEIIAKEQDKEAWIKDMKKYLRNEQLPNDEKNRQEILLTHKHYYLNETSNILYRIYLPNPKVTPKLIYEQMVLPQGMITEVLRNVHDLDYMGGHTDTKKTYLKMLPNVYFKNMYAITKNYVESCTICAERKTPRRRKNAPSVPPPMTEKMPFAVVQCDFMGPLTPSNGKRYIMIIIDEFSRWAIGVEMVSMDADKVANSIMEHLILKHSCPRVFKSDNASYFRSQIIKELIRILDINHRFGAPYHPQSQSIVERVNGTIMEKLSMYIDREPKLWAKQLQSVIFSYNVSVHSVTKETPFRIVYNRMPNLPIWIGLIPMSDGHVGGIQEYMREATEEATRSQDLVIKNTQKYQQNNNKNSRCQEHKSNTVSSG
jgi:transposase InsO family protein